MEYIIPSVLTLLVTVVSGFVLWLIKRERLSLEYEIISSEQFPICDGCGKYFIILLMNSGNRPIEHIDLAVELTRGKLGLISSPLPELLSNPKQDESSYRVELPLLNPKEQFRMTLTVEGEGDLPLPRIMARAVGVTAVPRRDEGMSLTNQLVVVGFSAIAVLGAGQMLWNSWQSPKLEKQVKESLQRLETDSVFQNRITELQNTTKRLEEQVRIDKENWKAGKPESQHVIFSIFNVSGLGHLLPELVQTSTESGIYWKTGLLLVNKFMSDDKNRPRYIAAMERLVNVDEMAPSSEGFNLYLLGKMEHYVGNTQKASECFARCKKEAPLMYDYLMDQDPFFDLKSIERNLKTR